VENTTNDLFSEIQEELRQERILKFWKAYHKPLLASVSAVVIGIVAYSSWTQHARTKSEEAAAEFVTIAYALDQKNAEQAFLRLRNLERTAPKKAAYLATIIRCSISLESPSASEEEKNQALTQLQALSKNPKLGKIWADLALLKVVSYVLAQPSQAQRVEEALKRLSEEGSPYFTAALELSAVHALQKGDKERARTFFRQIIDREDTSPMTKERALLMLQGPSLRS
jgi:hypothetical protein